MAILPISSVRVNNNHSNAISFEKRRPHEIDETPVRQSSTKKAAAIPVVMLMAMSPSLLNANEPVKFAPVNDSNMTEVLGAVSEYAQEEPTYVMDTNAAQQQKKKNPFGSSFMALTTIKAAYDATGNISPYKLVFTTFDGNPNTKKVSHVFFIPEDYKCNNPSIFPPEVTELVYHDLGKDKEFCGVKVHYDIFNDKEEQTGVMFREIRVDDDTANRIIDILAQDEKSKFINETDIKFTRTNSEALMEPYVR